MYRPHLPKLAAIALAAVLCLAAGPSVRAAEFVANGNFETSAGGVLETWVVDPVDYNGVTPNSSGYGFDFFDPTLVSLSQTISGLVIGQAYHLAFELVAEDFFGDGLGTFTASLGGWTLYTHPGTDTGAFGIGIDFLAITSNATLTFSGMTPIGTNWSLDNVSLTGTAVPGPIAGAGLPMLAAGLAFAALVARRRRAGVR